MQSTGLNVDSVQEGDGYIHQINHQISENQLSFDFWKQRMKASWIKFGDCPTPLMYRRVKQRQLNNEILTLKNENNLWVEGQKEVEEVVLSFIKKVYDLVIPDNHGEEVDLLLREMDIPSISLEDQHWLDKPFTDQEIKNAMFNMHKSKSPGPDGFTADFFHLYWKDVGQLVTDSVHQFLKSGNMLKECNQSLLVLIPKVKVPEAANQFRPINLCNTVYKCISKCLVNRIKVILPKLISENQNAFIPGRYMEDNVLLSHELMHLINSRKGSNYTAVKIDMSKAYDRVDWVFLLKVLQAYVFSNHLIRMVSQCISTVSFKAVINRKTTDHFSPNCGLRQGDPLSPYLFIFCMDILSRMLTLAEDINHLKGLSVSRRSPSILHLFLRMMPCFSLKQMRLLALSSGTFFTGFDTSKRDSLKRILSMAETDNMGIHLGTPIDIQGKKSSSFQFLVDKVSEKIVSWASLHISQSAKLVLINTVLATRMHLNPQLFLSRVHKGFQPCGICNMSKPYARVGYPSLGRLSLQKVTSSFREGFVWKVGNGESIMAIRMPWVNGEIPVANSNQTLGFSLRWKVSDFIDKDSASWKVGKVRECFEWNSAKAILAMDLPCSLKDDFLYWKFHPSGIFSVKTSYYFLARNRGAGLLAFSLEEQKFVKLIWRMNIQPKWKVFLWKLFHDGLAVKSNSAKRGIQVNEICEFCGVDEEDNQHLFKLCNLAKEVWENGSLAIYSDSPGFNYLRKWIQHYILLFYSEDGNYGTRRNKFIATLWGLWKTRNARASTMPMGGLVWSQNLSTCPCRTMRLSARCKGIGAMRLTTLGKIVNPPPPPRGFNAVQLGKERTGFDSFIVSVDGSWDKITTRAGIGWAVMGGDNGDEGSEGGKYGVATSALHFEAWACLEAMKWTRAKGKQGILILLDSIGLINNLQSELGKDVLITWLVKEIKEVGASFQRSTIIKVQRDQVQRADDIARKCRATLSNY
ncbi:uncharacterized protein LOC110712994 [Chenopodium quinoa]|uniref:uncharacterized protein LOC110712994 n=1 Tax=Chenopodium quinoa TaxID=63459 RepID=UPI000B76E50B|nr:uncharacterized protein LOC110712994 [Chenopodium quinoa]